MRADKYFLCLRHFPNGMGRGKSMTTIPLSQAQLTLVCSPAVQGLRGTITRRLTERGTLETL